MLSTYYPAFINIQGKRCVVVGGGEVALRKVEALLERKAEVVIISPALCPGLERLVADKLVQVIRREYRSGDLKAARIAIAATDNRSVNEVIAREAGQASVLLNVVDDAAASDFIVPSCISRGDLTIAISTSGKSPALARKLRTRLEKEIGDGYAALVAIISDVRTEVLRMGLKINAESWQKAIDLETMIALIEAGDAAKARELLLKNLKAQERE